MGLRVKGKRALKQNYLVNISSNSKKELVLCLDGVVVNNKIMCSNVNKITIKFKNMYGKKN